MKFEHIQEVPVIPAVITVSSTRVPETDTSGKLIQQYFEQAGYPVVWYVIVPDIPTQIEIALETALQTANCILFCGGTGLTHDDCTIETILPHLEKQMDGFGELFRWLSYHEIGAATILSRAVGGIIQRKAIFCIPGSSTAVRLAMEQILLPEIRHILSHAQK